MKRWMKKVLPVMCALAAAGGIRAYASEAELVEKYSSVLDQYHAGLVNQWSAQEYMDAGLCYLCSYHSNPSQVGYRFEDIDNNGVEELIIGELYPSEEYTGMIFELYTIMDGAPVRMASSTERGRYYLCQDGLVGFEGSSGASRSSFLFYMADSDYASLTLTEAVLFDADINPEEPWLYSRTGTEPEDCEPISETDAREIIDAYESLYEEQVFTSFEEYGL